MKKIFNRIFWYNIVAMIAVVAAVVWGTFSWMDSYTQHGVGVKVPNVRGLLPHEAANALLRQGLQLEIVDSVYLPSFAHGVIVEQSPADESIVKAGRTVFLTVNSGRVPMRTLPDVIDNCSLREAKAKLLSAGFKLNEHSYMQGETDWVYGVKYNGRDLHRGDRVPTGATLTLVVGDENYLLRLEAESDSIFHSGEVQSDDESWF